ncbi:hypothetical protein JFL43_03635 [Viridibacillus sp. YIM B01967]|uniref:HTH-type transcriptional regulator Rgg C-terminal domain-containing protein n=1 Tax=Viridibacillus soli TaxID=2798301 RepID=A0ABS1H3I7_9BACL|nr:hypothetical protein [Viridibacillus soli]MBK3493963.1 hypothetical protein [Viridibacillus soli]
MIRLSKTYHQSKVSVGVLHQTSYSKFELGKIEITTKKFVELLHNIEMSFEEFEFIHHSYDFSLRDDIIYKFSNLKFIDETLLLEIISTSETYLEKKEDCYIRDILNSSKGLYVLKKEKDFKKASFYAERVWKRLQQSDTWYLSDIRLVNSILFLFPIDTAIFIAQFAINQLDKYKKYDNYKKLILPFKYNLVHLLLKETYLEEAYKLNEELIEDFKEQKTYVQIALCYLRKGLIQDKLAIQNKENYIEIAESIAILFDDRNLREQLKNEKLYLKELMKL